jgi:hypothetical protein
MVPAAVVACRVTLPVPQREAPVVEVKLVVFTVAVTAVLVAETQPADTFLTAT